jgi:hypothetical protein
MAWFRCDLSWWVDRHLVDGSHSWRPRLCSWQSPSVVSVLLVFWKTPIRLVKLYTNNDFFCANILEDQAQLTLEMQNSVTRFRLNKSWCHITVPDTFLASRRNLAANQRIASKVVGRTTHAIRYWRHLALCYFQTYCSDSYLFIPIWDYTRSLWARGTYRTIEGAHVSLSSRVYTALSMWCSVGVK